MGKNRHMTQKSPILILVSLDSLFNGDSVKCGCGRRMRTADGGRRTADGQKKRDKKIKKDIENIKKKLYDKLIMKNGRK